MRTHNSQPMITASIIAMLLRKTLFGSAPANLLTIPNFWLKGTVGLMLCKESWEIVGSWRQLRILQWGMSYSIGWCHRIRVLRRIMRVRVCTKQLVPIQMRRWRINLSTDPLCAKIDNYLSICAHSCTKIEQSSYNLCSLLFCVNPRFLVISLHPQLQFICLKNKCKIKKPFRQTNEQLRYH